MMKLRNLNLIFTTLFVLVLSACAGSSNPVAGDLGNLEDDPPILGINTDGVSIDGMTNTGQFTCTLTPGSNHLVTFSPPADFKSIRFEAMCSDGYWNVDGSDEGKRYITMERALEWVAPAYETSVQLMFEAVDLKDGFTLGVMINVSADLAQANPRPAPIMRESTYIHPMTGQEFNAAANELLVRLNDNESMTGILNLSTTSTYNVIERVDNGYSSRNAIFRLRFDSDQEFEDAWSDLANDPRVDVVEPNYVVYPVYSAENDPEIGKKHEFPTIDAELAWDYTRGSSEVWVAVLDTGADRNHPDLAGNIVPGADFVTGGDGLGGETPGDGQDNNGDGIPDQNVGHGTHCAGIIAAMEGNSEGACGIAFNTKVMPLRIFPTNGDTGATFSSIIEAIEYATEVEDVKVISMSIATTYQSSLLQTAIDDAWAAGKICVAAAANSNTDDMYYPAAHNHVLSVAALNKNGEKASFSNYGEWIDICAPGTGIYSTYFDDQYAYMSGTSMATPLVAGCVALLFAYDSQLTPGQAEDFIKGYVTDCYDMNPSYIGQLGTGCVNPYMALNAMDYSEPVELGDAESDGDYSGSGINPGTEPQG